MKFHRLLAASSGVLASTSVAAQNFDDLQQTIRLESQYLSFSQEGTDDEGFQLYSRFQYSGSLPRIDFGVATGLIRSERESEFDVSEGSIATLTDTSASATYRVFSGNVEWLGNRRTTLAFNVDANLPTGQNQLTGAEKNVAFDSFIVDQDRYGEGTNVGIGASATIALSETLLAGAGLAYIDRGEFEPDGDDPDRTLNPGAQSILTLQLLDTTPQYQWNAGYRLIDEEVTQVDGDGVFDRATSHELYGSLTYGISDNWTLLASALYATRDADKVFDALTGDLVESSEDNNGDTYFLSLGAVRQLVNQDQVGLEVSRRVRGENEFDEESFSFAPSLTRDEIAFRYDKQLADDLSVSAGVSYFRVEEGEILGFEGPNFTGTTISLGASYDF